METKTKRIDYKALCYAPFDMDSEYEVNFKMLVYTGKKEEERPVFRVVDRQGCLQGGHWYSGQGALGSYRFGSCNGRTAVVQLQRLRIAGELGSIGPAAEETLRLDGTAGSGVGL